MKLALYPQGAGQWLWTLTRMIFLTLLLSCTLFLFIHMPGSSFNGPLPPLTLSEQLSSQLLSHHVHTLAQDIGPRNIWRASSMSTTTDYLKRVLTDLGYTVRQQEFSAHNIPAINLEVEITGSLQPEEIVVVGAHYDTVSDCPGANDNGSGLAALLELARLLTDARPVRTIRLVAFANEEPPFFLSKDMGSRHYAARSRRLQEKIVAMLSLETMGYYRDDPGSQDYPLPFSLFYPDTADFIAFVGNVRSQHLVRRAIGSFRYHASFPSQGIAVPGFIAGVGWSDHWSFWQEDYPAIMVTDTAFYRYTPYHTPADTSEKLDYDRLARVVTGLAGTILDLAEQE
jgi:Zn-dependent M28 family amino/carboxypeptidase